ncbi:hypothetical protein ABZY06_08800 [Streptomyces sp. NPDC006540]|uniref:hypothetical protein n=1 Tax=Streptomyces sp. NPDC006540 TaxID=3155353 RepID=UPI0033AF20DC
MAVGAPTEQTPRPSAVRRAVPVESPARDDKAQPRERRGEAGGDVPGVTSRFVVS